MTVIHYTFAESIEFLRRQYIIGRRYASGWWAIALATQSLVHGACWGSLLVALLDGCGGMGRWMAAVNFAGLYALHALRAQLQQSLAAIHFPEQTGRSGAVSRLVVLLAPWLGLLNLGLLWTSAISHKICWRGIRYWVAPGGRIQVLGFQYGPDAMAEAAQHAPANPASPSESVIVPLWGDSDPNWRNRSNGQSEDALSATLERDTRGSRHQAA
jgi:hypothetical protein